MGIGDKEGIPYQTTIALSDREGVRDTTLRNTGIKGEIPPVRTIAVNDKAGTENWGAHNKHKADTTIATMLCYH